ncbi:MAG TPA: adenylate kinase [Actinomycetota bacterium]|nr:adenylate kinase [Actinomycetota bacterium]
MRLVIFGPQGAGKGTQGVAISEKYGIPAISTGEIFRWAVAGKTALGLRVLEYVNAGQLVPNELTIQVVRERLEADDVKDGFILDGFPRNIAQAQALDMLLQDQGCGLDGALVIDVPQEISLQRILGRMACVKCGRNYSIESPPENDSVCDACGGDVVRRTDDVDEKTVLSRLETYHRETEPLKAYYEERGLLREVDGVGSPSDVFGRIVAVL